MLHAQGVAIPCVRCILLDFDVAYAPLLSSYGSCTGKKRKALCILQLLGYRHHCAMHH